MGLERVRIFISSPGDVAEERVIANNLVRRLADEFANRLWIEPVFWEHEPLLATETFQKQIPPPRECEVAVCILWSRLGTRLPPEITRRDGSRYASGTEYEFEDAFESRNVSGRPDLLVYRKTATPLVDLNDEEKLLRRLEQKRALDGFIRKWFFNEQDGSLKAAFHAFATTAEFEQVLENHLRKLIVRRLDGLPASADVAPTKLSWKSGSPFRGLDVFDFEHAPVFFGRTRAIGDVLNALRTNAAAGRAFVLLVGVSGGGKSSLVRAGVLPVLTQPGVIEGVGLWRRAVMKPSDGSGDLLRALARALLSPTALPELGSDGTTADELAGLLRQSPAAAFPLIKGGLSQAAAAMAKAPDLPQPDARLVVVADQLEEIFTLQDVTPAERECFIDALSALARSSKVWVIGTLRGDFYHRCFELPELVALQEGAGQYALALPTPAQIGQMIRQPARAAGLGFEEDPGTRIPLDDVLREAAGASPESLPLLEFALEELYQRRTPAGLLAYGAYRELGGVEGALAQRAESVFASLPPDVQATLPRVMSALVNVGEGEKIARQQTSLDAIAANPRARAFVEAFVKARLFSADRSEQGPADFGELSRAVVRVTHEALLRNWPRVQRWLEQDRELLLVRGRVVAASARWARDGRRSDFLLGEGRPLAEAEAVAASLGDDLSPDQRAFITASAARAGTRRRLRRSAVAALALLTVAAMGLAYYANRQRGLAVGNEQLAARNAASASASADRADERTRAAELLLAERTLADADTRAADGRWSEARPLLLDAASQFHRLGRSTMPLDSRLWESYKFAPPPLAVLGRPDPLAVAISGNGRTAVTGHPDGTLAVWDVMAQRVARTLSLVHLPSGLFPKIEKINPYAMNAVTLSEDGRWLLSGSKDTRLTLWDLSDGSVRRNLVGTGSLFGHVNSVHCLCLSRDGKSALSGGWGGEVHAWDLVSGKETWSKPGRLNEANVDAVALTAGGQYAAVMYRGGPGLTLYDARTGTEVMAFRGPIFSALTTIAASPDPDTIAVGDVNGGVRLVSLQSRAVTKEFAGHRILTSRVAFTPDGSTLISAGFDGLIRFWDVNSGRQTRTAPGLGEGRHDLAISHDGRFLAQSDGAGGRVVCLSQSAADTPVQAFASATPPRACEVSHDGRLGALVTQNGAQVFDLATGLEVRRVTFGLKRRDFDLGTIPLCFTADDSLLVWGDDVHCGALDLVSGALTRLDSAALGRVYGISDTADRVIVQSDSENASVIDRVTGQALNRFAAVGDLRRADFLPGGKVLFMTSAARFERIAPFARWQAAEGTGFSVRDLASGVESCRFTSGSGGVFAAGLRSGAQVLVAMGPPGAATWDLNSGRRVLGSLGNGGGAVAACFTHGGRVVVTVGSIDQSIRLWDAGSGQLLAPPLAATGRNCTALGASDDGRWLVAAGDTGNSKYHAVILDFKRPASFDTSEPVVPAAHRAAGGSAAPVPWRVFGEWYSIQRVDDWASECFEKARAEGDTKVSSLAMARCHWRAGNPMAAADDFERAISIEADPTQRRYLQLCLAGVRAMVR